MTPARTLHDAVPARPSLIEVPEDLHLLDPPESCPQEEISDKYDDVDPSPKTEEPMRATNRATEEERESMEAPKVLRTYAKRKRPTPSPAERQKTESPALFCTQESAEPHDESHRHPETEPLLSREPHMKMKPRNKREPHQDKLPDAKKRKRAASIKAVESEPPATPESDNNVIPRIKKKTKRKEQKKRRAPVNELALVSKLPAQIDSQAKPKVGLPCLSTLWSLQIRNEYHVLT